MNMSKEGWVCPICGRVNAPWVPECPCKGKQTTKGINIPQSMDIKTVSMPEYRTSSTVDSNGNEQLIFS